jgi:hypothetical protein
MVGSAPRKPSRLNPVERKVVGGSLQPENLVLQSRLDPLSRSRGESERVLQQRSVWTLPDWPTDRGTPLRADPSSTLPVQDIAAGVFKQDLHSAGPKMPVRGSVACSDRAGC